MAAVKVNKLPKSQIELEVELSVEEFNKFIEQAIFILGKDLEIKGFRKGRVPGEIIEKNIGPEKILIEAADLAVNESYKRAILEHKIEAISQPEIKIKKMPGPESFLNRTKPAGGQKDSFIFSAKAFVLSEIEMPDYKKISASVEKKPIKVEEKEIEGALKWLQRSRAKLTIKNQPAAIGDFVEIEYWSPTAFVPKAVGDAFILGEGRFIPGFEEQLIGMRAGQEKEGISVVIPDERQVKKMAGKKIEFKVKMNSVQNIELPEINNEFACNLGNFKNLLELKNSVRQGLGLEKEQAESQRVRSEILEKINQAVKCEIPEFLVEQEQKRMLEDLKRNVKENLKISFDEYLQKVHFAKSGGAGAERLNDVKKGEKEILDSFSAQARKRVKNFLILREISKREKIEVKKEEIKEEANRILEHYSNAKENGEKLDPERLKDYTKDIIRTEKTLAILENLAEKF